MLIMTIMLGCIMHGQADQGLCAGMRLLHATSMQEHEAEAEAACERACPCQLLCFTCEWVAPSLSISRGAAYATSASLCLSSALNSVSLSASKVLLLGSVRAAISCCTRLEAA
jgi:hypothetical protein